MNQRIMMKLKEVVVSITILLILNTSAIIAQSIEGVYNGFTDGEYYDTLKLKPDHSFSHTKGSSLGDDYNGSGTYVIKKDSLLFLNYEKTEKKLSYYKSYIKGKSVQNTIDCEILVYDDSNKNLLSGANIVKLNSKSGFVTNKNGRAVFGIRTTEKTSNFKVSYVGYEEQILCLKKGYSYRIEVFLTPVLNNGYPFEQTKDTLVMQIKNKEPRLVKRQDSNSEIPKMRIWIKI